MGRGVIYSCRSLRGSPERVGRAYLSEASELDSVQRARLVFVVDVECSAACFWSPPFATGGSASANESQTCMGLAQPADSQVYAAASVRFSSSGLPPHRGRNESLTAGGHAPRLWPSPSPASVPLRLGLVVPPPSVSSVSAGLVTRDKSVSSQYDPQGCCAPLRADIEPALGFRVGLDAGRHAAQAHWQAVRT